MTAAAINQLNATRVTSGQADREKERERQTSAVQKHAKQNSRKQRESPPKTNTPWCSRSAVQTPGKRIRATHAKLPTPNPPYGT